MKRNNKNNINNNNNNNIKNSNIHRNNIIKIITLTTRREKELCRKRGEERERLLVIDIWNFLTVRHG